MSIDSLCACDGARKQTFTNVTFGVDERPLEAAQTRWLLHYRSQSWKRSLATQSVALEEDQLLATITELSAFRERFVDFAGLMQFSQVNTVPNLEQLSAADSSEYIGLVATVIKRTDAVMTQLKLFHYVIAAVLDGVDTEQELIDKPRMRLNVNHGMVNEQ